MLKASADCAIIFFCRFAICASQALYQEPHKGKQEVREYFQMITRTIPRDLKFHVDAITANDPTNVGVKWYVALCSPLMLTIAVEIVDAFVPELEAAAGTYQDPRGRCKE